MRNNLPALTLCLLAIPAFAKNPKINSSFPSRPAPEKTPAPPPSSRTRTSSPSSSSSKIFPSASTPSTSTPKPLCDAPDFKTAGGHFNPENKQHGIQNPMGHHAGDLPQNIVIGEGHVGQATFKVDYLSLDPAAPNSILANGGTSIMVHEKADDMKTDPTGNAGNRIACGVITAPTLPKHPKSKLEAHVSMSIEPTGTPMRTSKHGRSAHGDSDSSEGHGLPASNPRPGAPPHSVSPVAKPVRRSSNKSTRYPPSQAVHCTYRQNR